MESAFLRLSISAASVRDGAGKNSTSGKDLMASWMVEFASSGMMIFIMEL